MSNTTTTGTTSQAGNGQSSQSPSLAYQLTSGKAYDPNAVYADASDARGHYEQINVKIPPRVENVMDVLCGDPSSPWRSRQDFVRDAILHHAHRMATSGATEDPLAEQLVEAEANESRMGMRRRLREAQRREYEMAKEEVEDLIEDQDWPAINETLDRVGLLIDDGEIPKGRRDKYQNLWDELSDAVTRSKMRELRQKNQRK